MKSDLQRPQTSGACGVLLVNLGTPAARSVAAVRAYLGEFLSDPRVVEAPRALWWPLLHGVILRFRPRRSAALYRRIWTEDGSPLLLNSQALGSAIGESLTPHFPRGVQVECAMRYGHPSIADGLRALADSGAGRIMILPLYPQYSATTSGSTFDAVARFFLASRVVPHLRFATDYHCHPGYIQALATSIAPDGVHDYSPGRRLLMSFHGIPKRYAERGDPYPEQCRQTANLVARQLGLPETHWGISFQSRVGRQAWLTPYTTEILKQWAGQGVEAVDVVCPGFAVDCLETLDEIGREARETFLHAGGRKFRYVPALNAATAHVAFLSGLLLEATTDWRVQKPSCYAARQPGRRGSRREERKGGDG